jgi:DivIVA domain-containing protein
MVVTPADVADKQFRNSFRGYNEQEVDGFLDTVEAELVRLLTENATLHTQIEELASGRPVPTTGDESAGTEPPAAAPDSADPGARPDALRTLQMAQRTADAAVSEARAEAEAMLTAARDEAQRLDEEAKARHREVLAALDGRRRQLEEHIEDLRAYEREYRARLRAHLENQLRELNGQPVAVPGNQPAVPADGAPGKPTPHPGVGATRATATSRDPAVPFSPVGPLRQTGPPPPTSLPAQVPGQARPPSPDGRETLPPAGG